ncbi:MAG: hypothetical protein JXA21_16230 [Anaerolineae bacterium]|nr:hypothetical protein [Anaerolineae bacterium]
MVLCIVATCVVSILIEGGVLMALERAQAEKLRGPRASLLRLWTAAVIANVASYSIMVAAGFMFLG